MPFIEALGRFSYRVGEETVFHLNIIYLFCKTYGPLPFCILIFLCCLGPGNFCLVHVSLVPVLNVVGEQVKHPSFTLFFRSLKFIFISFICRKPSQLNIVYVD